jgi:integrase
MGIALSSERAIAATTIWVSLDAAIAEYLSGNKRLKATSKATYRSKLDHALGYFGPSTDIVEIDQKTFSTYAVHVADTINDPITAGNHITTVSGMLNWLRTRHGLARLTTKTLIPTKSTPGSHDRDVFTVAELERLFANAAKYRHSSPSKYWVSILPIFTGCRLEEIAQLNLRTDLKNVDGIWAFDLNEYPDADGVIRKSLKNKASWRHVPIHPALVQHGLIDFLHAQLESGHTRPFETEWAPWIAGGVCKWGQYPGKWGGRELKKLSAPSKKLTYFHSQRHTFTQILADAKVPSEVREALLGHKYGSSEQERYDKLKANVKLLSSQGIEPGLQVCVDLLASAG